MKETLGAVAILVGLLALAFGGIFFERKVTRMIYPRDFTIWKFDEDGFRYTMMSKHTGTNTQTILLRSEPIPAESPRAAAPPAP